MLNSNTINIIKRALRVQGIDINFQRKSENAYGEIDVDSEYTNVGTIKGIFHESNDFFNVVITADKGRTETKKRPAILTLYENKDILKINDICIINGTKYQIISIYDVDLSNNFIDISLELIFSE